MSILALACLSLAGCSSSGSVTDWVKPYRIDIRQGNYVDQAMASQLRKGMTREQVRFALGTPLLIDPFRPSRWDYVYLYKPARGEPEERRLTLHFSGDRLDRVDGDVEAAREPSAPPAADK